MSAPSDNPFLNAVIANPDDDLTRLVYADWLDENGQPERAEFVRVQVALAAGVADEPERRRLEDRQRELLIAHDTQWVTELADVLELPPGRWGGWVFRRGFVEYFHLPAATIVQYGHALAALTPIRELYLHPVVTRDVESLCRCPWLARVRDLYLVMNTLGSRESGLRSPGVQALIQSPYTSGLKKLEVQVSEDVAQDAELMNRFEEWQRQIRSRG